MRPWTRPRTNRLQTSFSCGPSCGFQFHRKLKLLPRAVRFPGSASAARYALPPPPFGASAETAPCDLRPHLARALHGQLDRAASSALSVRTARTERLSAREGAHPQFPSAGGPQRSKRGTCPWACAGGSANCEHQRPGERIAATIAPAVPVLDLVVMPWLLVEFRSCRCRGCVRANWRGRVPRLPALHRGEQANLLTAARQKKS